jgi:anti-sigma factor RsiW
MNCLQSHQLLQQRLDGDAVSNAGLDEHLAACPQCQALHAAAARLQAGLRLLPVPAPPPGLNARIVAQVRADRRRRSVRLVLALSAVAAGLLVACLLGYSWVHSTLAPAVPGPPAPVAEGPEPPEPVPVPSLRDSVAEAGSAVVNLTRRKADETVGQTRLLWPAVTPPGLEPPDTLTEPLDPPARSLREAGQGVSAGLEPVTSSARRAFDLFLREIPPMGGEDKPGF